MLYTDSEPYSLLAEVSIMTEREKHNIVMNEHIKRINRSLICGWFLIVIILFCCYTLEVVKGERSIGYLLCFTALTALPADAALVFYRRKPDRYDLRYVIVTGYFIFYTFVMLTGSTSLVFTYILPMLSLLVLYHQPKLILYVGTASMALNLLTILNRVVRGELTLHNSKDAEIQVAVLFVCFLGAYLATRLYDDIHRKNEEYTSRLSTQNEEIQRMTIQTIMTIANTIDAKDEYTRGHSRRVSEYAAAIAKELGLSENEVSDIRFIGLLHDIGKIGIPDSVLNKPGKLTDEEYQVMKSHTTIGAEILKDINMIEGLDTGAKYHHERFDGHGYPDGLSGEDIPYFARIIAVADAYDAMSSNRIYRRHLDPSRVTDELKRGIGVQWDPDCVNALLRLLQENRLPEMRPETDMVRHATTILTRVISVAETSAAGERMGRDELTGVYGRDAGRDAIQSAIYQTGGGWLLLFNIDHFHRLNQVSGFAVGDACLKLLAEQIKAAYDECIIARFGSDEFAVYVPGGGDDAAETLAQRFYRQFDKALLPDGVSEGLSVSIGMTEIFTEKDRVMVLYEHANKALYVAKQRGGGTYYCHQVEAEEESGDGVISADLARLVNEVSAGTGADTVLSDGSTLREALSGAARANEKFVRVVLFTIRSAKNEKPAVDERDRVMELLRGVVAEAALTGDVVVKYSSTQFALFATQHSAASLPERIDRILTDFFKLYSQGEFELHYDAAPLA